MPTRAEWQQLAEDRILDAQALLTLPAPRWSAVYYLAGYAVECGPKACVLVRLSREPDVIYREKRFMQDCWTHDIEALVEAAGLKAARDADILTSPARQLNWQRGTDWNEKVRYEQKTQAEAERLFEAVTHPSDGVMQWIRRHW